MRYFSFALEAQYNMFSRWWPGNEVIIVDNEMLKKYSKKGHICYLHQVCFLCDYISLFSGIFLCGGGLQMPIDIKM